MSIRRRGILTLQALLTFAFLGLAIVTFFGNPFRNDALSGQTLPVGEAPQALRLTVRDTGIAAVTARELRNSKLPFTELSADTIELSRGGETVPIYVRGEGSDAVLYFYAEAITRSVETPAVYWLSPGRGKSMSQRDGSPQGIGVTRGTQWKHWEENSTFQSMATGDDAWLGANVFAPDVLEILLTGIQPTGGPGELKVRVWSSNQSPSNPDHHVKLHLNDRELTSTFWDGVKQETLTVPLSPGVLREQGNRLRLEVPGDTGAAGESIYLDWLKLKYEGELNLNRGQLHFRSNAMNIRVFGANEDTMAFDVTEPNSPVLLINTEVSDNSLAFAGNGPDSTYLVLNPRDALQPHIGVVPDWEQPLKSAERGADYVAIVPEEEGFEESLQPLLEYRRQQGYEVLAVSVRQIYDEFNHGRRAPEAIRSFLQYALSNWEPAPRYVLLAGDASFDVNDYTNGRNDDLIPVPLVYTHYAGYVGSDNWYTVFDGELPNPDLAIGRMPAQHSRQLRVMAEKTVAYEEETSSPWSSRALLVADDEDRFNTASEVLAGELYDHGYAPQKLYMTENEEIHDAIIGALNHGVSIVNYVGHGGIDVWGDETVLKTDDAPILRNGRRLPLFTTFTCLNGYFYHPEVDALAETLLWTRGGGIAAAVAPSGRTYPSQQGPLSTAFYKYLLHGEEQVLGDVLLKAKLEVAQDPNLRDIVHVINLLGDPALRFRSPRQPDSP